MTVQTNTNVASFNGNGVTQIFPIAFKFNNDTDLVVLLVDSETGASTQLTLNSDYTVSGDGEDEGGAVTVLTAPTSAQRLKVARLVDILQLTDLRNQGKFFAEIHEDAFDLLTMIAQQQETAIRSAIRVADADPEPTRLPSAESRANKVMGFDENGNPIATLPASGSGTELAIDLANTSNPAKGAGMVGVSFDPALTYPAGTVGARLKDVQMIGAEERGGNIAGTVKQAISTLGAVGRMGVSRTPASFGHRMGQIEFIKEGTGRAKFAGSLARRLPKGANVTPQTVDALGLKAYYVKNGGGNNTVAGTSWATAFASVSDALAKADVDVVFVAAGNYFSTFNMGNYTQSRNVSIQAIGGPVNFISGPPAAANILTWATTGAPNVYKANDPTQVSGLVALNKFDAAGYPFTLVKRDNTAEVASNPGSWSTDGASIYVQLPDRSAPVVGSLLYYRAEPMRCAAVSAQFHVRGVTFIGGTAGAFSARSGNGNTSVIAENCAFLGCGNGDGFQIKDISLAIAVECYAARNFNDGYNYHSLNGLTPHFLEINCVGVEAQAVGSGNGSTAHEDVIGIRIGCHYAYNNGSGVADVGESRSYNVGCTSRNNGPSESAWGFLAQSDLATAGGVIMYLDGCEADRNSGPDMGAGLNAEIYYRDVWAEDGGFTLDGGSTASLFAS